MKRPRETSPKLTAKDTSSRIDTAISNSSALSASPAPPTLQISFTQSNDKIDSPRSKRTKVASREQSQTTRHESKSENVLNDAKYKKTTWSISKSEIYRLKSPQFIRHYHRNSYKRICLKHYAGICSVNNCVYSHKADKEFIIPESFQYCVTTKYILITIPWYQGLIYIIDRVSGIMYYCNLIVEDKRVIFSNRPLPNMSPISSFEYSSLASGVLSIIATYSSIKSAGFHEAGMDALWYVDDPMKKIENLVDYYTQNSHTIFNAPTIEPKYIGRHILQNTNDNIEDKYDTRRE